MAGWIGRVADFAEGHDGVFSVEQAAVLGVARRSLRRAAANRVLVQLHRDVFAFSGSPLTDRARIRAAVLQVDGSRASHEATLRLHGVDRVPPLVAVSVDELSIGHSVDGVRVHRLQDLVPEHLAEVAGIPATTIERAVVDVTSVFSRQRMKVLLDQVTIERRLTSIARIGRTLRQVNRRGRVGIGRLGPLLDERGPRDPSPRSQLERLADSVVARSELPVPVHEHPLPSERFFPGFVDRCWLEPMLILEIDGRSWHAREAAMRKDRARDREAARLGWQTLRVLGDEIDDCADAVVDDLVTAYRMRIQQLRRSA